jgi:hypothetical protein
MPSPSRLAKRIKDGLNNLREFIFVQVAGIRIEVK